MSESYSKKRRTGDRKTQEIQSQSSGEKSDQTSDVAVESSEDSISLPAMILSPISSVEAPSIVDSPLAQNLAISDLEKTYTDYEEIIRNVQDLTKNEHLVKQLNEIEISNIYEKICSFWENLALEHQEERRRQSTSTQSSASISSSTSKLLSIIRNEIQALRTLDRSSEDPFKSSSSVSMPIEETSHHSETLSYRKESTQSTSFASELQSCIDSTYSLELVLRLIRYSRDQMEKSTSSMSSGEPSNQSAKDSKEALRAELLREFQICMIEESETLKTCIDNFQKSDCTSDKIDTPSGSEVAEMESEDDISVATEIQVISSSASSEVRDDVFKTEIKKVFGTSAEGEKVRESSDVTTKRATAPDDTEMKEIAPLSEQEMSDLQSDECALRSDQIPLLADVSGAISRAVSRQQRFPDLTLCFKSSKTDVDDGERSTGPCATEDTLLSTPDEDTGKSISSIPWDSSSFHSSIPDEQLDSETEETEL